ncbi:MAG: hypothetical protein NW226_13415 [Microscillaceae bacterium]|nr:hypothetical protein [Microscillaceae bacterium]
MADTSTHQTRYPGVVPFSTEQADIFFGREGDIQRLYNLVIRENITLLYAKSGLGKSSLINAGLVPVLQQKTQILPLFMRLGAYTADVSSSPVQTIIQKLPPAKSPAWLDKITPDKSTLWYHLKSLSLTMPGTSFLLIFDQFEELFTYPQGDIFQFKKQVADLIYKDAPEEVWKNYEDQSLSSPKLLSEAELDLLEDKIPVKVLMSIREDRYSQLNQITDYLPNTTQYRYALEPLSTTQAQEAILEPAAKEGIFTSASFEYSPEAIRKILDYLSKQNTQPIESTQLQILCNRVETLGLARVEVKDIPEFEDIFLDYYYDTLAFVPKSERLNARKFIENQLVQEQRRLSVDELVCKKYVPEVILEILVNRHLLRRERNSVGGISLELAHDTLIAPIEQARQIREAKEAQEKAEKDRLEEEKRLKEQAELEKKEKEKVQKQLRTTRSLLVLAVLALVVAAAGIIWASFERNRAKKAQENAKNAQKMAENSAKESAKNLKIAYEAEIKRQESEIAIAQRNKASFERFDALDLADLETQKMDSLRKNIDSLKKLIQRLNQDTK